MTHEWACFQSQIVSDSEIPWTAAYQTSLSFSISWSVFKLGSIKSMMSFNHLILFILFSSYPQPFPASGSFPISLLFASGSQSIGASASVLPMNIQGWFPLGQTVWSPCSPRNSQESSPEQFESINSLALSLLYGPTLTSTHDSWKCMSGFDYTNLCWQSDASAF